MSKLRTITIDPQFLSISKKKQKTQKTNIPLNEIKLNSNNIRELLLEKLKQHKKNKKTLKNPHIQLNTMDEQLNNEKINDSFINNLPINNSSINNLPINNVLKLEMDKIEQNDIELPKINSELESEFKLEENVIKPDKPYGILKNGNKPTYKNWVSTDDNNFMPTSNIQYSNMQSNNMQSNNMQLNNMQINNMQSNNMQLNNMQSTNNMLNTVMPTSVVSTNIIPNNIIQDIEVKKVFNIGKNKKNKTISVLLKNNTTRKKIENDKINLKKSNLSTVKNFLKKQNLIKFGTTAPNNLLREIYESTKLCGDIINENNTLLMHNFKEA